MSRRAPLTIWFYVAFEMWRLVLLTAAVLLCVTAFGITVKYLADGKLSPADCLKVMFLFMPPMLHYVLPFAACFGATLAYHRLAADNEALACHAGGIGHRSLLMPAIASGLVLSMALVGLSNYVIPRFLHKAAEVVTEDVTRMIVASIERGEAVRFGDRWLYADAVSELGPDPKVGAYQRLWLGGVLVVSIDKNGEVREQGSARVAYVWLQRTTGRDAAAATAAGGGAAHGLGDDPLTDSAPVTRILFQPEDYVGVGRGLRGSGGNLAQAFYVSNALIDDPKFMTWPELRRLGEKPELVNGVDRRRRELAVALAQRETIESLRAGMRAEGRVLLADALGQKFVLHAADVRPPNRRERRQNDAERERTDWLFVVPPPGEGHVVMEALAPDGRVQRRQSANTAWLRFERGGTPASGAAIAIQFNEVSAEDLSADGDPDPPGTADDVPPAGAVLQWRASQLVQVNGPAAESAEETSFNLIRAAESRLQNRPEDAAVVGPPLDQLKRRISNLEREVLSKIHERLAMAAACLVMVALGAVMAMRLRDSLPLTIYLWAFFPALAAVITVSAGQQLTHQQGPIGLLLMWGGVGALGGYTLIELGKLSRH